MSVGHIINKYGIPEKCPNCGQEPIKVKVTEYDPLWQEGKVVCANCEHFIRDYDASI